MWRVMMLDGNQPSMLTRSRNARRGVDGGFGSSKMFFFVVVVVVFLAAVVKP